MKLSVTRRNKYAHKRFPPVLTPFLFKKTLFEIEVPDYFEFEFIFLCVQDFFLFFFICNEKNNSLVH